MDSKGKRAGRSTGVAMAAASAGATATAKEAAIDPAAGAPPPLPRPEPAPVATAAAVRTAKKGAETTRDFNEEAFAVLSETQGALARGLEAMTVEMAGLARAGIAAANDAATAMLSARTLPDAIEINVGFARQSVDTLIGSSAKFSEIGIRFASEAARPIFERFGEGWRIAGL